MPTQLLLSQHDESDTTPGTFPEDNPPDYESPPSYSASVYQPPEICVVPSAPPLEHLENFDEFESGVREDHRVQGNSAFFIPHYRPLSSLFRASNNAETQRYTSIFCSTVIVLVIKYKLVSKSLWRT